MISKVGLDTISMSVRNDSFKLDESFKIFTDWDYIERMIVLLLTKKCNYSNILARSLYDNHLIMPVN